MIQSLDGSTEYAHNSSKRNQAYVPASTFKIANTLIALEAGVIKNQFETIQWDGVARGYAPWNQDQTLATAFARSCVWCYQRFAKAVGDTRYRKALVDFDYGNHKTGEDVSTFWLHGDLRTSVQEQVNFLRKIHLEKLPVKRKNIQILKNIMFVEETPSYKLWAKSGLSGKHGWYVGYVESGGKVWLFANYIEIKSHVKLDLRKNLTIESLKLKGLI